MVFCFFFCICGFNDFWKFGVGFGGENLRFFYFVFGFFVFGLFVGYFFSLDFGNVYEVMFDFFIFFIGVDLGMSFNVEELKKFGKKFFFLLMEIFLGFFFGGVVGVLVFGIDLKWGFVIGVGCGWYLIIGLLIV